MKMKKYEFDKPQFTIEGKSFAECFRQFWAHFNNIDMEKMIETIEYVEIRTSDNEYFVAKNGSKKKNIYVKDGYYIYTHLTPKAMEKAYEKFIKGWNGEFEKSDQTKMIEKTVLVPETDDDASNTEIEQSQPETEEKFMTRDEIAEQLFNAKYDELKPHQKGQVGKKYKKQKQQEQQLTTDELSEVQL